MKIIQEEDDRYLKTRYQITKHVLSKEKTRDKNKILTQATLEIQNLRKKQIRKVNKGMRRMTWHQKTKKDATTCEKLRGAGREQ